MDRIVIAGLRELGVHGVLAEEQTRPQPFEVDVELSVDATAAGDSDGLDDTVDYSAVAEAVSRVVRSERYQLLERLATRIAEVCRVDERVLAVTVTVRKLHPPVRALVDTVAVRNRAVTTRLAYLGLGSNLGDRAGHLQDAVDGLAATPRIAVVAVSAVYETTPVGGPPQPDYLNAAVATSTDLTPHELLTVAHRLEHNADRVRGERWGPRTLDVDVLLVDGEEVHDPDLEVPHPRLTERGFVLAPLADLGVHPGPAPPPGGWPDVRRTDLVLVVP